MSTHEDQSHDLTLLVGEARQGDRHAAAQVLELVYEELRRLAGDRLRHEQPGQTLQATALVHEAYLRLIGPEGQRAEVEWDNRGHFFAAAAEAMRRILIERARSRGAIKRGGDGKGKAARKLPLDPSMLVLDQVPAEVADLDEALTRLDAEDPTKAMLVKLRFYAGLSQREAALAMGISTTTADRYWAYARAWLFAELSEDKPSEA